MPHDQGDLDVNFATSSRVVDQRYRTQVQNLADFMKAHPEVKVELKGHADQRGSSETNRKLSLMRAERIKSMLVEDYNIPSNRVEAVGYGESAWNAPRSGVEGQYRNRSVEAQIYQ